MSKQTPIKGLIQFGLHAGLAMGAGIVQAGGIPPSLSSPSTGSSASAPWVLAQAATDEVPIYGSQLMTEQERVEYRARWRAARTDEERAKLRSDHHEQMKARARERGVTLPDDPPATGAGAGPGGGMGLGAGGGAGGPGPGTGAGAGPGGGGGAGPGPGPRR